MIQERSWFSQIDSFIEYFPHRIKILLVAVWKSKEAGPFQHLDTPIVRFCLTSFVEELTERERKTEDIQRAFHIRKSDCRSHDLHHPKKDCSIAPDSYPTGLGFSTARTLNYCLSTAHLGVGAIVVHSKASPVRRSYDTLPSSVWGERE